MVNSILFLTEVEEQPEHNVYYTGKMDLISFSLTLCMVIERQIWENVHLKLFIIIYILLPVCFAGVLCMPSWPVYN